MAETRKQDQCDTQSCDAYPPPLVQGVGLWKGFHSNKAHIQVLQDLSIHIKPGETLAVVGASGIGKSTLLHILGTLDRPDSGTLMFQNENVFEYDDQRLAKFRNRTMGFVFQFHHLLPEFTAIENVMMPALIQGMAKEHAAQAAEGFLLRVGLAERLNQKVTELSGGEQQRVALARALVLKPSILLADEPTGNLDKANSEQVHQLLLELNTELTMALVVVTHNTALASRMARQATITDGQLEYL
jgi:lipoprotein-releasing system ATP-binding protein